MGTNFYWTKTNHSYENHIGKRSAAGLYCWDCKVSLCKGGEGAVHYSHHSWYESCPNCGKSAVREGFDGSAAGMELGFAKPKTAKPKGVRSCSSFTWAIHRDDVEKSKRKFVWDEYGKRMTKPEFLAMLKANCPIQFFHVIGLDFS